MKTRLGFVSNSSTSSFVVLGYKYEKKRMDHSFSSDAFYDLLEVIRSKKQATVVYDGERGYVYFGCGEEWSNEESPDGDSFVLDGEQIEAIKQKIKAVLVKYDIWEDKFEKSFGLHYGNRSS